ncbi:glycosyltransferase family 2 protein, partial [bacterium]|nr:glycosyltransferase family 2 protein [bacterium]
MAVTALIPTKNRSKLLLRAIQSVLNQTYPYVVVKVRDNCSTDETEIEVTKLCGADKRIFYSRNTHDIGPHENFRQGLKEIQTDYFSILGDDDFLERSFYEEGIKLLRNNPNASFVVFTVDIVDADGKLLFNNSKNCKINRGIKQ